MGMHRKDYTQLSETDRGKIVVEFVEQNQGCTMEEIVNGLYETISRGPLFQIVKQLVSDGVLIDNKEDRRSHRYLVNKTSILASVQLELDTFEKSFFNLVDSIITIGKQEYDKEFGYAYISNELSEAISIFHSVVTSYLFRCLMMWQKKIKDKKTLEKLCSIIFPKLADLEARLIERLPNDDINVKIASRYDTRKRLYGTLDLIYYHKHFNNLKMSKEIEPVLDAIWKINKDLQQIIYPEPGFYKWQFNYGQDDWRKLLHIYHEKGNKKYKRILSRDMQRSLLKDEDETE